MNFSLSLRSFPFSRMHWPIEPVIIWSDYFSKMCANCTWFMYYVVVDFFFEIELFILWNRNAWETQFIWILTMLQLSERIWLFLFRYKKDSKWIQTNQNRNLTKYLKTKWFCALSIYHVHVHHWHRSRLFVQTIHSLLLT